jgi:hypothetical protein
MQATGHRISNLCTIVDRIDNVVLNSLDYADRERAQFEHMTICERAEALQCPNDALIAVGWYRSGAP